MYIAQNFIETQDLRSKVMQVKYSFLTVYNYYENIHNMRNSHVFFCYKNIL